MIVTTTDGVDGKTIKTYLGIVSGEAIFGANILRDFMAGIRDVVGGRSSTYEKVMHEAKEEALREMTEEAAALGADAVVGIDLDYEIIGGDTKTMLMVSINGTAVKLG